MLNLFANMMFIGVILAAIYVLGSRVIKLPLFVLKEINVEGMSTNQLENTKLRYITRQEIESIARNEVRGNFFTVNLDALRETFKSLPWVRSAKVQRTWPSAGILTALAVSITFSTSIAVTSLSLIATIPCELNPRM